MVEERKTGLPPEPPRRPSLAEARDAAGDDESSLSGPLAMVRVGRGERDAFHAVFERYRDDVYAFLIRMVLDRLAAEDLLQETFLRVFKEAARYDPCRPLQPWIFRIARNLAVDFLRSRGRARVQPLVGADEATIDVEDETASPIDEAAAREREALLHEGLAKLRPSQREIIVLIDLEGKKYEEVGELLGISVKAVGARLRKARRRFLTWARANERRLVDTDPGEPSMDDPIDAPDREGSRR